jgi:hypothetical protein
MNKEQQEQRRADLINRMRAKKDWRPSNAVATKSVRWAKEYTKNKYEQVNSTTRQVLDKVGRVIHESVSVERVNENLYRSIDKFSIVR